MLTLLTWSWLLASIRGEEEVLYLLGLQSLGGPWSGGHATRTAVEMGLERINGREDILPGYQLQVVWENTQCNAGLGVHNMYKQFNTPPVKIMVLGAACSPVSEATAQASHHWNTLQISYLSASPSLSDKSKFPLFFRISSPNQLVNPARIQMMKDFKWSRVATIHESTDLFSKVTEHLVSGLQENNITLITSEIFTDDPSQQVLNLKRHDARIIVAAFYENKAYKVFCEAYKQGMYGPKYVWMILAFYNDGWWTRDYDDITCTGEELAQAAEGAIGTGSVYISRNEVKGLAGYTPSEWQDEFKRRMVNLPQRNLDAAPMAYDAVWAAAICLNLTQQDLRMRGSDRSLESFAYDESDLSAAIYESMMKVEFQGVKGYIRFDKNGDNEGSVKIRRIQGGVRSIVGYYEPVIGEIEWLPESPLIWQGGSPPPDASTHVMKKIFVNETSYIVMSFMASLGIILSLIFFIFNITYRNERLIKMSSPRMNNIIIMGCIVAYITVFLQERSDEEVVLLCKLRTITLMVGFSLAFGALFSKTWRVYAIFMNRTKKVVIKDEQLMLVVAAIVSMDIIIAVTREIVDPMQASTQAIETIELDGGDLILTNLIWVCTSPYDVYFKGIVYTIKGLLLIFGAFLALQTRKVKIPALNDSQYIGLCIYNVAVLSLLGVVLTFALSEQVDLSYIFTCSFIIIGTTLTQLIIFIPKMMKFKSSQVADLESVADFGTVKTVTVAAAPTHDNSSPAHRLSEKTRQLEEAEKIIKDLRAQIENQNSQAGS